MLPNNYNVLDITMPTYLQDIFRSTEFINLIYTKVHPSSISSNAEVELSPKKLSKDINDLSLIGNPLEVDLGDDVSFEVLEHGRRPNNWTKQEATYGHVNLKAAREYLNTTQKSSLQVCLCDAKDPRKTLVVFHQLKEFYRGSINYYGCYALHQEEVSFGTMLKHHQRYCPDAKVEVAVNTLYPIIGFNKRLAEDSHKGVGNSAFIEVFCLDQMYKSVNNKYKLFLQVNASSSESKFHVLWQQLNMLHSFIVQLQDEDDLNSVQISQCPRAFHEVADDITALLRSYETKQYNHKSEFTWKEMDVMNMRDEDFLEKLYCCLIHLHSLEDIVNSFHTLFTDLVEIPISYTVPAANKTTLGVIINGLIEGNMIVPTLNPSASLKFLIELGLNKLHNDYVFLIQNMEPKGEMHFKEKWEKISQVNNQITTAASRKSRMTIPKGNENVGELLKQLNHIANMHLTTEFMYLAKSCKLSETETLPQVYEHIFKCKHLNKTLKSLQHSSVVDFECALFSNQFYLIRDLPAVAINIKYFSEGRGDSKVTTIFHFSEHPIFPDTVFNDYDIVGNQVEVKQYYVHKANILIN